MNSLQTFNVFPSLPHSIQFLDKLSRNLWWSWHRDAIDLFRRIDPKMWLETKGNPLMFLTRIPPNRLMEISRDESFLVHQQGVMEKFITEIENDTEDNGTPYGLNGTVAYFSMEFGIHESLPLFAGGLGILAGDHLKSASDMGLPLTGVGLFYQSGYFHQYLDHDGYQQEEYPETDVFTLPMFRVPDSNGNDLIISVDGPMGIIHACVWKLHVGRIPLYLLDTNIGINPTIIRCITSNLYAGDYEKRLAQEVLLGIGGIRALSAMNIFPTVCHINEGHPALASIERLYEFMTRYRIDIRTALEIIPRSTVFTTHTPVAAGHDEFPAHWVEPYLKPLSERLDVSCDEMISWGQPRNHGVEKPFSMFILGKRMAHYCNGVSRLHGRVARRMWAHLWPGLPESEIPITHITNGVHVATWISHEYSPLFERYIGPNWELDIRNPEIVKRFDDIYDEELWRAHEINRARLVRTCRKKMIDQYRRRHAPLSMMKDAESVLDQGTLTIAFARRFASYKRAYLILQEPERLEAMIASKTHPVQFIFSGKAHPKDKEGKDLIKRLVEFARRPGVRHRIVFLEDYDIHTARYLVQGADVWLNNPRRPFEACGTSGMKAAINGVLNASILDGWWDEAYTERCGWIIGDGFEYTDSAYQDIVDCRSLFNVLENEVIPCFYERDKGGLPIRWIKMMKESMKTTIQNFSSARMVSEYEQLHYLHSAYQTAGLLLNNAEEARRIHAQGERLMLLWKHIVVQHPVSDFNQQYRLGDPLDVSVDVFLGTLHPDEVEVELCVGKALTVDGMDEIQTEKMYDWIELGTGHFRYRRSIICTKSGRFAFTVRVMPKGDDRLRYTPGLITWAL
ncbi:MAG: alpha-glucan family phosphorylase [Desulfatirhabdiaceae bacterium]